MSRSYNKHCPSDLYLNYKTEEEFNHALECWKQQLPKPQPSAPYPPRPKTLQKVWWSGKLTLQDAPYGSPECIRWWRKCRVWNDHYYKSEEYINWYAGDNFERYSRGQRTWKDYVAWEKARIRSDRWSRYRGIIPKSFIREHHHKPRRQNERLNIQRGYRLAEYEDWGDLVFIKQYNDAGWYWY